MVNWYVRLCTHYHGNLELKRLKQVSMNETTYTYYCALKERVKRLEKKIIQKRHTLEMGTEDWKCFRKFYYYKRLHQLSYNQEKKT